MKTLMFAPSAVGVGRGRLKSPRRTAAVAVVLVCAAASASAAQQDTTARRQQRALDSLTASLRAVQARMDTLERAAAALPVAQPVGPAPRAAGAYMNIGFDGLVDGGWSSTPNVTSLQGGDHDPLVRGFTIPNAELTLDAAVDPYFKGFANIVYKLDAFGETSVELEEVYAITTHLPANLQAKLGQFLGEFGRENQQHPHAWSFIDQALVLTRMFGPDGLRGPGARMSWLAPTSFYTEALVAVMNSVGETAFSFRSDESALIHGGAPVVREVRSLNDLLIVPRLTSSVDLGDNQTVVAGVSGAFGPNNSGFRSRTEIYGADLYWKWKSPRAAAGFPFVSLQSEVLLRRYDAAERFAFDSPTLALPAETLHDGGMYAQLLWGIRPRIVAGLRGEYVSGDSASFPNEFRDERVRFSPNFTWYPTEFSKFRLQYNFDHRKRIGNDSSLWMQFEFIMGAHAAHKF